MVRRLVAALLMSALLLPLEVQAQNYGGHGRGGGYGGGEARGGYGAAGPRGYGGGGERGYAPGGPGGPEGGGYRGPQPGGYRGAPQPGGYRNIPQGPMVRGGPVEPYGPPPRRITRGQYMPPEARGDVVQDFARYHLRRPPRGYYWYRTGDDFVLASVATGVVFEVIPAEGY